MLPQTVKTDICLRANHLRLSIKPIVNVLGKLPKLWCHCTIYFENKVYMFRNRYLYVYDKLSKEINDITKELKGKLLNMWDGTSTVVNDKVINTGDGGT